MSAVLAFGLTRHAHTNSQSANNYILTSIMKGVLGLRYQTFQTVQNVYLDYKHKARAKSRGDDQGLSGQSTYSDPARWVHFL